MNRSGWYCNVTNCICDDINPACIWIPLCPQYFSLVLPLLLEDNVIGGMFSCVYGQCISAMRICESGKASILGYKAVGKACLVQFGDAGALVLK